MTTYIGIDLKALPDTNDQAHRIIERFAAVATGLALEGISTQLQITPYESEDDDA